MTAAVLRLSASYLVLVVLLLSLNLKSAWRWPIKACAITVALGFVIATFVALEEMLGWPTEGAPPAHFQLYAALVREPDRSNRSNGAIYLWLVPRVAEGQSDPPPRAYALPYSRALHEQVARAQARLKEGQPVDGTAGRRADGYLLGTRSLQVELYQAPPAQLPPKTG
jgi:hypothetical protein